MKATFAAVTCPVIPAPRGTDAAREAMGMAYLTEKEGALFPVDGGFIGYDRMGNYSRVSPSGEVQPLGVAFKNIPGYGIALPSAISPDRSRLLILEAGDLRVLAFATGARESLGVAATAAAWIDDDRIAVADGKTVAVRRVSSGEVLGERSFGEVPSLAARADGVVVVPYGDVYKPKTRSVEVYRLEGAEIVAVGKKTKVPFTFIVPFEGELYLVEKAHFGNWVACFKLCVNDAPDAKDGKKAKKKADGVAEPATAKPWATRRVAPVSIGRTRDDAKLEEALATFPPKVRSKGKLDQVLDCTTDERGLTGFTIDAGGESKASAASVLEVLALAEVKALPHLSVALDGRGALGSTVTKALIADKGKLATVTGLDLSGTPHGQALAKELLTSPMAASLERFTMRESVVWELPSEGLAALESLDLEDNRIENLPASLPRLRRLRLTNALYDKKMADFATFAWVPGLVELRLAAKENHYSFLPAATIDALADRGLRELRELSLSGQRHTGDAAVTAFAASAPALETALLARTAVTSAGAVALVKGCPRLRSLDLAGSAEPAKGLAAGGASLERLRLTLDDESAHAVAKNPDLGGVRRLLLIHGKLGPSGVRALVTSRLFERLTELTVDGIPLGSWESISDPDHLGEDGTVSLAEAASLADLTYLRLRCATLGDEGARALATSPHLTKLSTLDLDANKISPEGIVLLLERLPSLKKLTCQLRDKSGLERVREAAFRRGIELALFHGLYKL